MNKFIKISLTILAVSALVLGLAYVLSSKSIEFHLANNGSILCIENKNWGIFQSGELTCKGLVEIVQIPTPTPQKLSPTGEIILSK